MMTGDDGRDGRLIVAFFFWGGGMMGVDDDSWGRSFMVGYLKILERCFIYFIFYFFGLQKETTHFPKLFFGPIFGVSLFFDDKLEDTTFWK